MKLELADMFKTDFIVLAFGSFSDLLAVVFHIFGGEHDTCVTFTYAPSLRGRITQHDDYASS